nr:MAG TPA: hypothetical protein [Caudoviricetes sp.]
MRPFVCRPGVFRIEQERTRSGRQTEGRAFWFG